ncbi:hypothetical protein PIB30_069800, partial [Stylosanthes scabra]|nr:hypothetical protein [Stylosanthes scabra]
VTCIFEKKKQIIQLTVNGPNDHHRGRRARIRAKKINGETIRFLMEHLGSNENERVEGLNWKNGRELGRRKVPRRPIEALHLWIHSRLKVLSCAHEIGVNYIEEECEMSLKRVLECTSPYTWH